MLDHILQPNPDEVLKVTDLTRLIKSQLEGRFARIWVRGEISNLRRQSSGHVYFSLKDSGSQLPCVLFARDAANQSFELKDGMEVLLLGDLSVYEPYGRYQLVAKVAIQSGEGRLQLEFERLKRKLAAEGLFAKERKKALPTLTSRIAVITSPTGAALQDFLRILRRREFRGEIVVFPARVQGKEAPNEIRAMLQHASASDGFDCIVLTRGGGSIEDLWAFNDEALAREVAACPMPVISAIGHEIDHVLTDYAADHRAETPSGAAELLTSLYIQAQERIDRASEDLSYWMDLGIMQRKQVLSELKARMQIIAPERRVEYWGMRLDELENKLCRQFSNRISENHNRLTTYSQQLAEWHPRLRIQISRQKLNDMSGRLDRAMTASSIEKQKVVEHLKQRLENGSLTATLKRGFAIVSNLDGKILSKSIEVQNEEVLQIRFNDGVTAVSPKISESEKS